MQVSLLPPIAAIAASAMAGPTADSLIARGVRVETVRKAAQCTAFLGPAACLLAASFNEGGPLSVCEWGPLLSVCCMLGRAGACT